MRHTITVPTQAQNYDDAVRHVCETFASRFGGFTTYDAQGGWVAPDGDVVHEPVTVVETYTDDADSVQILGVTARRVKDMTDETAVMWTADGQARFE